MWLFTILRNKFVSDCRRRRREIEDPGGRYLDWLKSPPVQHSRMEFDEFRRALAQLPSGQRDALVLVGASGFSYAEAAAMCGVAVGTIRSRVHSGRRRLAVSLGIDNADDLGPDLMTRAVLAAAMRG